MGLFDFFGPKKTASASHILLGGPNAVADLTKIKEELVKSKSLATDFATKAAAVSTCPSSIPLSIPHSSILSSHPALASLLPTPSVRRMGGSLCKAG
jgi:hypothetical protein